MFLISKARPYLPIYIKLDLWFYPNLMCVCVSSHMLSFPTLVRSGSVDWSHHRPSLYRSAVSMAPIYSSPKQPNLSGVRLHSYAESPYNAQFAAASTTHMGYQTSGNVNNVSRQNAFSNSDMMGFLADLIPESLDAQSGPTGVQGTDSGLGSSTSPNVPRRLPSGVSRSASLLGSLLGRKRRVSYTPVSQSELLDRFRKILVTATDLAIMYRKLNSPLRAFVPTSFSWYTKAF